MRYAHNVERVLGVPSQAVALLAVLMLRGPQTVGELRHEQRAAAPLRRHLRRSRASSTSSAARPAGALVVELPRQPGARETRWAHLLSGMPDVQVLAAPLPGAADGDDRRHARSPRSRRTWRRCSSSSQRWRPQVARLLDELGIRGGR